MTHNFQKYLYISLIFGFLAISFKLFQPYFYSSTVSPTYIDPPSQDINQLYYLIQKEVDNTTNQIQELHNKYGQGPQMALAVNYFQLISGNYNESEQIIERWVNSLSSSNNYQNSFLFSLLQLYLLTQRYEMAESISRSLLNSSPSLNDLSLYNKVVLYLSLSLHKQRKYQSAINILKDYIKNQHQHSSLFFYFIALNYYNLEQYERVSKYNSYSLSSSDRYIQDNSILLQARLYAALNDFNSAITFLLDKIFTQEHSALLLQDSFSLLLSLLQKQCLMEFGDSSLNCFLYSQIHSQLNDLVPLYFRKVEEKYSNLPINNQTISSYFYSILSVKIYYSSFLYQINYINESVEYYNQCYYFLSQNHCNSSLCRFLQLFLLQQINQNSPSSLSPSMIDQLNSLTKSFSSKSPLIFRRNEIIDLLFNDILYSF